MVEVFAIFWLGLIIVAVTIIAYKYLQVKKVISAKSFEKSSLLYQKLHNEFGSIDNLKPEEQEVVLSDQQCEKVNSIQITEPKQEQIVENVIDEDFKSTFEKICFYKIKQDDSLETIELLLLKASVYEISNEEASQIIKKYSSNSFNLNDKKNPEPINLNELSIKTNKSYAEKLEKYYAIAKIYSDSIYSDNIYKYLMQIANKTGIKDHDATLVINKIKMNNPVPDNNKNVNTEIGQLSKQTASMELKDKPKKLSCDDKKDNSCMLDLEKKKSYSEKLEKYYSYIENYLNSIHSDTTYQHLLRIAKERGVDDHDANLIIDNIRENTQKTIKSIDKHPKLDHFIDFINLALSDGVLSKNELNILLAKASDLTIPNQLAIDTINGIIESTLLKPEVTMIDESKEKGDSFEKFIVLKFPKQFYSIAEWRGDKYIDGYYAKTTKEPDILIEIKNRKEKIAVECKFRTNFYKNSDSSMGFIFKSDEQVINYNNYAISNKILLFYAIGIGGEASNPKYVYIIPSDQVTSKYVDLKKHQYNTDCKDKIFYYNYDAKKLLLYKKS